MKSTINKIIDIEATLVQKSTGLLTKIHDLSYTEEDPINKKLSDILALFSVSQSEITITAPVLHMIDGGYDNADALGDYYLIDTNATDIDRVWKHESKEYYIKINEASTSGPRGVQWHVTDGTNKKCTWAVNISDNPYNDDGSSLQWYDAYWPVPLPNIIMTEQTYSITADDDQPEIPVQPSNLYIYAASSCGEENPNEPLHPEIAIKIGDNDLSGVYEASTDGIIVWPISKIDYVCLNNIKAGNRYTIQITWSGLSKQAPAVNNISITLRQDGATGQKITIPNLFDDYYAEHDFFYDSGSISQDYMFNKDGNGNWILSK